MDELKPITDEFLEQYAKGFYFGTDGFKCMAFQIPEEDLLEYDLEGLRARFREVKINYERNLRTVYIDVETFERREEDPPLENREIEDEGGTNNYPDFFD